MAEPLVEYNYLSGNSGVKVSNICLGTMVFGAHNVWFPNEQLVDYDNTCQILNRFVEAGGNFIDTANVYCDGTSEEFIGNWLSSQQRDNIVLATKCRISRPGAKGIAAGLSRKAIMFNVEESLKRLKTGYIDLYQIHSWDSGVPLEETLSTLNDLVRAGKVHYLGGSNLTGWQLQRIYDYNDRYGFSQFVSLQQLYNILDRTSELDTFEVCRNHGIGIIPWSPLKGGLLTGKHKREAGVPVEGTRIEASTKKTGFTGPLAPDFNDFKDNEQFWKIDELLHSLAQKYGKTVAQVSVRWVIQRPNVSSAIVGARSVKQLDDNLGAGKGWKLSEEDVQAIDDLSAITKPYPLSMIDRIDGASRRPGLPLGRQF